MSIASLRLERVLAGNCAFCGNSRKSFAYLCDKCAKKHRDKQRIMSKEQLEREHGMRRLKCQKLLAYIRHVRGIS